MPLPRPSVLLGQTANRAINIGPAIELNWAVTNHHQGLPSIHSFKGLYQLSLL